MIRISYYPTCGDEMPPVGILYNPCGLPNCGVSFLIVDVIVPSYRKGARKFRGLTTLKLGRYIEGRLSDHLYSPENPRVLLFVLFHVFSCMPPILSALFVIRKKRLYTNYSIF